MTHRLGIIGGGNMGLAIARGAVAARVLAPAAIAVADPDPQRRDLAADLGCATAADPAGVVSSEQLLLAVKPQTFADVARVIGPLERPTIVISIMAGLETDLLQRQLGPKARIVRAMPNTPCQLGEGMTGIALGAGAQPGDDTLARQIFEALGRTVQLDEELLHAVTAVSGSGPAYVYLLAELMEKAAGEIGLDPATAQLLVVQTIIGAGRMLRETGSDPAELRRIVTTPQGTTAAAVDVMVRRQLPEILIEALTAARDRGRTLAREADGAGP
ncbi:MAG: pyrroline-5-carboxylate reductase [Phycisphaerales bacterium]|nr:pyrroline-5-carboxylate reductase [Phycisphaerae bacterium]NNF42837.1 pyrroline-5-carboxylate reductase [Phycisphaerales bacterium]NNM25402.1 pyrroline-5-carboxylate reductase [Phycisphaerales bacterium]